MKLFLWELFKPIERDKLKKLKTGESLKIKRRDYCYEMNECKN